MTLYLEVYKCTVLFLRKNFTRVLYKKLCESPALMMKTAFTNFPNWFRFRRKFMNVVKSFFFVCIVLGIKFVFNSTKDCEVIHGALYSCLRAIFGLSVIGILICIFSCMLVYQLLRWVFGSSQTHEGLIKIVN